MEWADDEKPAFTLDFLVDDAPCPVGRDDGAEALVVLSDESLIGEGCGGCVMRHEMLRSISSNVPSSRGTVRTAGPRDFTIGVVGGETAGEDESGGVCTRGVETVPELSVPDV